LALAFVTLALKGVNKKYSLLSDGVYIAHESKSAKTIKSSVKSAQITQLGIKKTKDLLQKCFRIYDHCLRIEMNKHMTTVKGNYLRRVLSFCMPPAQISCIKTVVHFLEQKYIIVITT
jgi:hypothetical protein